MKADFGSRVAAREVVVGVVGLGYVGLPLAISFAEAGFRTVGFDVDATRCEALNRGESHIGDVSSERVETMTTAGRMVATDDRGVLGTADAIFICVPTPFDKAKTPDLSFVRSATHVVAEVLRPGSLVILQSTTYPGTTTEVVQPILEQRGQCAGRDFHLAFSPERVDPGNTEWTVHNTPKVVGGLTEACTDRARLLLEAVMDHPGLVHPVSSPAAAEMAKLLENTYRAVNIALVNELAMLSHEMHLDVWEVIDAAETKPFGFDAFRPGIGPGGHCIPVDPLYLSWKAREYDFQTKFIELAADVNSGMARYAVQRAASSLSLHRGVALRGAKIHCLGAAFKPGVTDLRNSRAVRVMELLTDEGAEVSFSDPLVRLAEVNGVELESIPLAERLESDVDLIMVLVRGDWPDWHQVLGDQLVFDAVGALEGGSAIERL